MFACTPTLDPNGGCSITDNLFNRIDNLAWTIDPKPRICSQIGRPKEGDKQWVTINLNPTGLPIRHGSSNLFISTVRIYAVSDKESSALEMVNFIHDNIAGVSATATEEFCLSKDLPQSQEVSDGVWSAFVNMPIKILRSRL